MTILTGIKEAIATEVMPYEKELLEDQNGKFVILNCNIQQFRAKKEAWKSSEIQNEKKRKLFADIIDDDKSLLPTTHTAPKKQKQKQKDDSHQQEPEPEQPSEEMVVTKQLLYSFSM
jgi:nucleolar protein 9